VRTTGSPDVAVAVNGLRNPNSALPGVEKLIDWAALAPLCGVLIPLTVINAVVVLGIQ
jgi:hypothetical protein